MQSDTKIPNQQTCGWCGKSIPQFQGIPVGKQVFCSEVCHLRFLQKEVPNLGAAGLVMKC
jgi:hypothetical protein